MLRVGRHRGRWTCWLLLALGPLNSWGSPAAHRTLAGVVTDYVAPAVTAGYLVLATVGFRDLDLVRSRGRALWTLGHAPRSRSVSPPGLKGRAG